MRSTRLGVIDMRDPLDMFDPSVRECWICGYPLTHDDDHLSKCPVCCGSVLVPYGDRYLVSPEVYHEKILG